MQRDAIDKGWNQQTGWHLPRFIIQRINEGAKERGIRPGAYAARILQAELTKAEVPTNSAELLEQMEQAQGWRARR